MDWTDDAIVLSLRRHGENAAVVHLLTQTHGLFPGLVNGAASKANRGTLQTGNRVRAVWTARLEDQLGRFSVELTRSEFASFLDDPKRLAALSSACALTDSALTERQPLPALFLAFQAFLDALPSPAWATVYVHWELALLKALGYGLDLGTCAAGGPSDDLAFVSPRTGRAVSRQKGEEWRGRLLILPPFLSRGGEGDWAEILSGLRLTAHFLDRHVLAPRGRTLPAARLRLVDRLTSMVTIS
jgi:DNA repair protein RecO (recombination protein O)